MSRDRREEILVRLTEISQGIDGIAKVARNRSDVSGKSQPTIVVLDADETADDRAFGRGRPPSAPNIIGMSPEIYIMASGGQNSEALGTVLNGFRAQVLKAVLTDATLRSIVGTNGDVRYEGCATDLARGRSMEGELGVSFTFHYVLNPAEL